MFCVVCFDLGTMVCYQVATRDDAKVNLLCIKKSQQMVWNQWNIILSKTLNNPR